MSPSDYSPGNSRNVPGASSAAFDFGDGGFTPRRNGYGSFQLHNFAKKQVVFALNNFRSQTPDVGIGNNPKGHPDYTFSSASRYYNEVELVILVKVE